jgi:hypothetical protein
MRQIWKEFKQEILVLGLGLVAVGFIAFDLVTGRSPGSSFLSLLQDIVNWLRNVISGLVDYAISLSLSDLVIWGGIILVIAYIVSRIRHHYQTSPRFAAGTCPRCGSSMKRVHRTQFDRLLSQTLLPGARRYHCMGTNCGWDGLRHARQGGEKGVSSREVSSKREIPPS